MHCAPFGMISKHQRRKKIELMTSLWKIDPHYISMAEVHYREQSLVVATAKIIIMGSKPGNIRPNPCLAPSNASISRIAHNIGV